MKLTNYVKTEGIRRKISYGKIEISFCNFEEACAEFEKSIDELLYDYESYKWIVEADPDLKGNQDELEQMKQKIAWMRKKA